MVGFAVREFVTTWLFLCIKEVKSLFYLFDAGKPVPVLSQRVLIWEF